MSKPNECDLSTLPIGAKFWRSWHPQHGVYTVWDRKHGSITTEVRTADGRLGELVNWCRVVPAVPPPSLEKISEVSW